MRAENWLKDPLECLKLPDDKGSGAWQLTTHHVKKGDELLVIDFREAFITGKAEVKARAPKAFKIHFLTEDGSTVMSSMPREYRQMFTASRKLRGNVLIGGLGLGLITVLASQKKEVKSITIVEKENDVISLVGPSVTKLAKVDGIFLGGLFYYLENTKKKFDTAFYDIWTGTSEYDWITYVVPLRRLSARAGLRPSSIVCWMEGVMVGQIVKSFTHALFVKDHDHWWPKKVFVMGLTELGVSSPVEPVEINQSDPHSVLKLIEYENTVARDPKVKTAMSMFINNIGSPMWESVWGKYWDQLQPKKKEE